MYHLPKYVIDYLLWFHFCPYLPPELEELQQALKWTQLCLTDSQSQQDVDMIMQLLVTEDFRNAFNIYTAVSQQKSRVSPTSPLTVQAEDLCQEVGTVPIILVYFSKKKSPFRSTIKKKKIFGKIICKKKISICSMIRIKKEFYAPACKVRCVETQDQLQQLLEFFATQQSEYLHLFYFSA